MEPINQRGGDVLLKVRVQPKASRNSIIVQSDGRIRVALTAPPVDGKANKALLRFVAKSLGISRADVSLVSGEKSREKTLALAGVTLESVQEKMQLIGK